MNTAYLIDLFFSFSGKISRPPYWFALLVLLFLEFYVGFQVDPNYLGLTYTKWDPTWPGTFWALVVLIPRTAITLNGSMTGIALHG